MKSKNSRIVPQRLHFHKLSFLAEITIDGQKTRIFIWTETYLKPRVPQIKLLGIKQLQKENYGLFRG